jgi:hypothetical protein
MHISASAHIRISVDSISKQNHNRQCAQQRDAEDFSQQQQHALEHVL